MTTIHQRRKTDRERQKKWRKRKLAEGQKQILVMLSPEAQKALKHEKKLSGETYVQIINRTIIGLKDKLPRVPKSVSEKQEQQEVHDLIPRMDSEDKNRSQLSKCFKDGSVPTLSRKGKWFPRK